MAVFVWVESRVPEPLLALELFRSRTFATSSAASVVIGVVLFGVTIYVPVFVQGVLGSLRSEEADLAPSPTLDDVPRLIENARLADVQVELERGLIPALPSAIQLSAYRIVQEALTNIIKHAAPARCTIRITTESDELHVAVINNGVLSHSVGKPGHGLIGMRERAALHHGTLVAGAQADGGFAVHARLPYQVQGSHG